MKKYYLIYQITNKLNGMIYIGKHQTSNIDDGYMGSGIRITKAIKKYGVENFEKTILFECASEEEMNAKEAEIVNAEFISRDDVYNLTLGGSGGWYFSNQNPNNHGNSQYMKNKTPEEIAHIKYKSKLAAKAYYENLSEFEKEQYIINSRLAHQKWLDEHPGYFKGERNPMYGKTHSEKARKRLSETHKGSKNSQYGTCWIYSDNEKKSITIQKTELQAYLNKGWSKGRKMKFD